MLEDHVRVLVVGTGLGTNAALGLEVPLSHGKWLTDGAGGVVEVTSEERGRRYSSGLTKGFMGEEFKYVWECDDGYLGNAGFLYAVLLLDRRLKVDIVEHPFTEIDRESVITASTWGRHEVMKRLEAEKTAMWTRENSESYAQSIQQMLRQQRYAAVLAGSKGVYQLVHALVTATDCRDSCNRFGVVLINGAEEAPAYDGAPSLARVAGKLLGHPYVHRLLLSSHGEWASGSLRREVVHAYTQRGSEQLVGVYAAKDVRSVPNREVHALPWSLIFPEECWQSGFGKPPRLVSGSGWNAPHTGVKTPPLVSLILWASATFDGTQFLDNIMQYTGPPRLAEVRLEIAALGRGDADVEAPSSRCFRAVELLGLEQQSMCVDHTAPRAYGNSEPIYDILFDAQHEALQVVLLETSSGSRIAVQDILDKEGQMATRLVRFFRCYDEKSKDLELLLNQSDANFKAGDDTEALTHVMLEELCGLNKNFGNFLWTGMMSVATAHTPTKRFGKDVLEVVLELELVRLSAAYLGFDQGTVNSEHVVSGTVSLYGDALDNFLLHAANADDPSSTPAVREVEGYTRRDFTAGGRVHSKDLGPILKLALHEQGLAGMPQYEFRDQGHSTGFRFFSDGKAWLSTSACPEDFNHARSLARQVSAATGAGERGVVRKILTGHESILEPGSSTVGLPGYQALPQELLLSDFLDRNGYRVVAYRRLGNAAALWHGSDGWEHFADAWRSRAKVARPLHFHKHGPAQLKSKIFGWVDRFPAEIGRGGTDAKAYFYDSCIKGSGDRRRAAVQAAVNRNVLSWWEPQLYAVALRDVGAEAAQTLPGMQVECDSLSFSSEDERLCWSFKTLLDVELGRARNLWLAGLQLDGLSRRDRPFPSFGSLQEVDAELSDWVAGLVRANIQEQDRQAAHQPSYSNMGPTNARRVSNTGTFDANAKGAFLRHLTPDPQPQNTRTVLFKSEVVAALRSGLRTSPSLAFRPLAKIHSAAAATKGQYLSTCGLQAGAHKEEQGCDELGKFLCSRVAAYNVFKDLQDEVNVLLQAIDACS